MQHHAIKKTALAVALASSYAVSALAQETTQLEELIVVGKDYYSILPDEATGSAFGLDMTLAETPRSVTEVRGDLIEKFALRSVDDLVRLTPGSFTSSFFGIKGAMDIRGEPADNYFRGFRRVANPGAFNTIVRGAEKLEVLRGPVSPLYGSGSVGGQLNYIPKSAKSDGTKYIDGPTGSINVTVGTYDQRIVSGELGLPFTLGENQGGVQLFVEVEDSESYFDLYEPSSELYQLAFDIDVGDNTVVQFGAQYQNTDSIQVPGWTRVTQDLIDNGTYITGAPPARNSGGGIDLQPNESGFISSAAGISINDSFSGVGTFCVPDLGFNQANYGAFGQSNTVTCFGGNATPWISPISNPGTAQIDHKTTFIDPEDYADTQTITLYADVSHTFDNDMVWKTELFYDKLDHTKYQSWGFTALYPGVDVWEARTSLNFEFSNDSFSSDNVIGLNYRQENIEQFHAFFDETFDFRDMLAGVTPDDRIAPASVNPFEGVIFTTDGNGNNTGIDPAGAQPLRNFNEGFVSTVDNVGIFFLSDIAIDQFSLLLGGRYDQFDVDSINVAVTLLNRPYDGIAVSDTKDTFSFNTSLSYHFDNGLIPYFTYAESNSLSTNQAGGISPGTVRDDAFVQPSELTEIGVKYEGMDGALYAAFAYYEQEKQERLGQTQALAAVFSEGYEFEMRALLGESWSLIATATHSDTTEIGNVFTVINGADFAAQNGLTPDQVYGGRISTNRDTILGQNAEVERAGLPDNIASVYGNYVYSMDGGDITASLGVTWVDSTHTDIFQTIKLPSYSVWNGSISYATDQLTVLLQLNNIFEEEYYTSADLFDSVVVKPSEGGTAALSISYDF